jgi:hypothetical protein
MDCTHDLFQPPFAPLTSMQGQYAGATRRKGGGFHLSYLQPLVVPIVLTTYCTMSTALMPVLYKLPIAVRSVY